MSRQIGGLCSCQLSRIDFAQKSANISASTIGGKRIPNQVIPKKEFESGLEEVDRIYNSPEFQEQTRQFIRDSSTIPENEFDQPMSTISSCPIMLASIVPKE
ncbi:MAG TPA: hypothetical protein P5080_04700 [Candidatus Paceibacterota bacterium]|nr:hypothetical protein [Candidatus Pacearchaeota archaeon]HRZ51250.1 hypothetical protein [Candidatus Paceibacterota bacterium]HSA36972.1 hypothetical protein [Candidatus Paceibacterota bacterium]